MKNKRFFMTIGVLLVVIAIATGLLFRQRNSSTKSSVSVPQKIGSLSLPIAAAYPTLYGSMLYYLDLDSNNFASLDLATGTQKQLGQFLDNPNNVLWSTDGTKVLNTLSDDGSLSVITTATGFIQPLDTQIFSPTWSTDGKQILYSYNDSSTDKSTITIADANGKNWQNIVAAPEKLTGLWWSPLGTYAVGIDSTTNADYYLIAISSKKATKLAAGRGNGILKWSPSGKLALLDSSDNQSLNIADVTTELITNISLPAAVNQFAWQDETHLVGLSEGKVVSIDLPTKKMTPITSTPTDVNPATQVLGVYKNELLYENNGKISVIPLSK